ncbi:MAG: cupredoxin domain-containing protein [Candidatus Saccharimonadales bacterium]
MPEDTQPPLEEKHEAKDDVLLHIVTSGPLHEPSPLSGVKKYGGIAAGVGLLILVIVALSAATISQKNSNNSVASIAPLPSAQVTIQNNNFSPKTITVKVGQAVTWVNSDASLHQIASDPYPTDNNLSSLNSKTDLSANDKYSYVFNKPGTYTYHDELNPFAFDGTVIVK